MRDFVAAEIPPVAAFSQIRDFGLAEKGGPADWAQRLSHMQTERLFPVAPASADDYTMC